MRKVYSPHHNEKTQHKITYHGTKINKSSSEKVSETYNPYRLRSHNIFVAIWGIINFIVGVIGNSLTIVAIPYAVYRKRYGLDKAWLDSTIFIINLAVSDLMYCTEI